MNLFQVSLLVVICCVYSVHARTVKNIKKRHIIQNIVGGNDATPNSYPWMAAIYTVYKRRSSFSCGGSLVQGKDGKLYILTAAHCASSTWSMRIRLGEHDLEVVDDDEVNLRVKSINIHPDFKGATLANDVALLGLWTTNWFGRQLLQLGPKINVGTITQSDVTPGDMATVIGWGDTTQGGDLSRTLQEVELEVQSSTDCAGSYGAEYFPDSMFCAGPMKGGQDSCQGDSGGPIMANRGSGWEIIGVVSWGEGCAQAGFPGVYTDLNNPSTQSFLNSFLG